MKYSITLLVVALATFTSALPRPAEAPGVSWDPSEDKLNALMEKRHGGHGPPDGDSHGQQQQQQQQSQQQDDQPYSYNPNPDKAVQEEEDNITWLHLTGNTKE